MRTLVVAGDEPWPEDSGSRMRLAMVVRGLTRTGPVDLLSVVSKFRQAPVVPDGSLGLDRVGRVGFDNRPSTGFGLVSTALRPAMPFGLPWRDQRPVIDALDRFSPDPYDLVWYFGARPWVLSAARRLGPCVVDLDDLEDQKVMARLSVPPTGEGTARARLRRAVGDAFSREEVRRWRRLHRRIDGEAAAVVVCSTLDAGRARESGLRRVAVVPNGYPDPCPPVGRPEVGSPPTLVFQGLLRYPPNIDACTVLVREVAPLLRRSLPEVRIRLVGDHHPELMTLHDPPRVTVVGRVPDMAAELSRADAVVVPVRYGSGTRVKILEAMAHGIPVVSSPVGAEGLEVTDGEEILLGRTPAGLADACLRLLVHDELRRRLVARARSRYAGRYRSDVVEAIVAGLATDVAKAPLVTP